MLAQQLFNGLVAGSIYALFAMGFTLTFGVLGVVNLLYGFYVAVGAFLALAAARDAGLPLRFAAVLGALGTGVIGVVCDAAVLTPLRRAKLSELNSMVVTLGALLLMNSLMFLAFGAETRRFPPSLLSEAPISIGPLQIGPIQVVIMLTVTVMVCGLSVLLERTKTGMAVRALAENPGTAALMGVNVGATAAAVSFLSAIMIGSAGILIGLNFNAVHVYMGEPLMLRGFAVVVLGGLGDIRGALVAGVALGLIEVLTAGYLASSYKEAVTFAALILTLWLRPAGLFGRATSRRV